MPNGIEGSSGSVCSSGAGASVSDEAAASSGAADSSETTGSGGAVGSSGTTGSGGTAGSSGITGSEGTSDAAGATGADSGAGRAGAFARQRSSLSEGSGGVSSPSTPDAPVSREIRFSGATPKSCATASAAGLRFAVTSILPARISAVSSPSCRSSRNAAVVSMTSSSWSRLGRRSAGYSPSPRS